MKHEEKICPRCKATFECKVGSVSICQCSGIKINEAERNHMNKCFNDCLCANCIKEMKTEFQGEKLKKLMR